MIRSTKIFVSLLLLTIPLWGQSSNNEGCNECHGDKEFTRTTESGQEDTLYVDMTEYEQSVHGSFDCKDCHSDAKGDPHPDDLAEVNCSECHEDVMEMYSQGIHGKARLAGDLEAPACADCHGEHDIRSSTDKASITFAVNLPKTCGSCHHKGGVGETHEIPISEPFEKFEHGIHGQLLAEGIETAASCASCHESHGPLPLSDPASQIYWTNISSTCGQCHAEIQEVYDVSSHGKAIEMGVIDAPTCITCHGEHDIIPVESPLARTSPSRVSEETCSPCHGMLKLNERFGILPDRISTYMNSYHGLARHKGSKVAANCVSCHGVHNILSAEDSLSTINKANLTTTCGACHPNASQTFAESYIHTAIPSLGDRISSIVRTIYIYLIIIVIGGMLLHNFIIWFGYVRAKYRELQKPDTIRRFKTSWVIQHLTLLISFSLLVITGFTLKYATTGWVAFFNRLGFDESVRGTIHRVAGVILLALGVFHVIRFIVYKDTRREIGSLIPGIQDLHQFSANMKYHLGMSKDKAQFARYAYTEKAEYWAVAWGTIIMGITGLVLWFPVVATKYLPAWIVKVSETLHFYEAILATLAILLYHMFYAIFHPEDYPLNLTFLTGKLKKEEVKHRYPEWYKEIEKPEKKKSTF